MRSDRERLLDILEAIEKIGQQVGGDRSAFERDPLRQVWVVHYLEIIGEAAGRLSTDLQNRHPEIPWNKITGMRHVLIHGYFDVDLDIVWSAVENDLPDLKQKVTTILGAMEES
jgi:uncharacterized protein with HEPN domain